jgi:hypothetical protein
MSTDERTWGGLKHGSKAELLEWHCVEKGDMPDCDLTVMMWVQYPPDPEGGATSDWASGWWDGEVWRHCSSGGVVAELVTHWAAPDGPAS